MYYRKINFHEPLIEEEELDEIKNTLKSGWITTGNKVSIFENNFSAFIKAPKALAVSSATDAMQIALATYGIGQGDEVITTTMTFCSTIHVIEHVGAKPILVDVEPEQLTIDPEKIEKAITKRTKAIMPVHLYGHPCRMDEIIEIAKKRSLVIIEDAAHALPAYHDGRIIGSPIKGVKWATCFSFYATKNITTAEGGMITGDEDFIEKARIWSLHGMSKDAWKRYSEAGSWYYEVIAPGYKCNMTDIQASLGLHQLKKLDRFQKRRNEIASRYSEAFKRLEEIQVPTVRKGCIHAWHIYAIRLNLEMLKINRDQFIEKLKEKGISTSVHFIPNHFQPYYRDKYGFKPDDFPVAYKEYFRLVSLPIYPKMSDEDVEYVIQSVCEIIKEYRK